MIKVLKPQAYGFPDNGVLQAAADVHPRGQAPHLPDEPLLESRKIMARDLDDFGATTAPTGRRGLWFPQ